MQPMLSGDKEKTYSSMKSEFDIGANDVAEKSKYHASPMFNDSTGLKKMTAERMFFRQYDLSKARLLDSKCKELEQFQGDAVVHFSKWYDDHKAHSEDAGEILFLPTGAGKTNVAIRFLCLKPLSEGYKVLWLAHTHHLLEQAFYSFEGHIGKIFEPKPTLSVRVVSGTKGHFRVHAIETTDDVIIATLQTITKAYNERHPALESFLNSAEGKIFVVFDEAHHAPAPSYRRLILNLRKRYSQMYLLGLTATPYSTKEGWLAKIFPQHFINIVLPSELMAEGILAKPIPEPVKTDIIPDFDEREYKKWIGSFRENLPEEIITKLAEHKERNLKIAKYYAENRDRLGKTIIFADRWFQCEQISRFLENQGVKNGTIYTHIDADPDGNADARNKRKDDENDRILKAFRENEIQVLINVRMLTEGTDIPDVQTVFITMQTTSQNLLTQMIGRALRGPKFRGTEVAYLVFFIDNWKQLINWADYQPLVDTIVIDELEPPVKHLPVEPISIELVRKLADMMYRPETFIDPFKTLLPLGWYMVEYVARADNSDSVNGSEADSDQGAENHLSNEKLAISEEIESIKRLVMVFEHEEDNYKKIIKYLLSPHPTEFEDEGIQFKDFETAIAAWSETFFPHVEEHFGSNLAQDIFSIVRHIAQNEEGPKFFKFEERDKHDLDLLAKDMLDKELNYNQVYIELEKEYNDDHRYWKVFYPSYDLFYNQYNICAGRILRQPSQPNDQGIGIIIKKESPEPDEPSDEVKVHVRKRDSKCLCCGGTRPLVIDHIVPKHYGGSHEPENLQVLCKKCNIDKNENYIDFTATSFTKAVAAFEGRKNGGYKDLKMPPKSLPRFVPPNKDAGDPSQWDRFLRRTINFFYQCSAVHDVLIGMRGESFYHWRIQLNAENDPKWIKPYLKDLLNFIRNTKENAGYGAPKSITISAPNMPEVSFPVNRR